MRFICEKCELPMDFKGEEEIARDSMKVSFSCHGCGARFSMVTNPGETQLVYSLGVKIGGKGDVKPLELTRTTLKAQEGEKGGERGGEKPRQGPPVWTPEAEKRLENVPAFIRPMAKRAVEGLADKKGLQVIDEALMDEAKGKFMEE
jgi:hypothetical protein